MLDIGKGISIGSQEIEINPIRAQGAGGQNVNKVSSAIHLRFSIPDSSLPDVVKQRLLSRSDSRISKDGVFVIKAQQYRTQEQNRVDALERLKEFLAQALVSRKKRIPTRPRKSAVRKRLDSKKQQGRRKRLRGPVQGSE